MPKRDSSGKFIKEKEEEELKLVFNLPPLSRIIFWLILLIVLTPWIVIFFLFKIWKEIMKKFEHLFFIKEVDGETTKKNGLFY